MAENSTNTTLVEYKCARKQGALYSFVVAVMASPVYIIMLKILIYRFKLTLPRHKILLSLTISDSIQIVIPALLQLTVFNARVDSNGCQIYRKIVEFTAILTVVSSSGDILLLSWERYVACIHCLRFFKIVTHMKVNAMLFGVWIIAIVCGLLEPGRYKENLTSAIMPFRTTDSIVYIVTVLASSLVLIVVQARLYLLSRSKTKVRPGRNAFGKRAEEHDMRRTQIKLTIVASAIVLLYMACMCPFAFYLIKMGFHF